VLRASARRNRGMQPGVPRHPRSSRDDDGSGHAWPGATDVGAHNPVRLQATHVVSPATGAAVATALAPAMTTEGRRPDPAAADPAAAAAGLLTGLENTTVLEAIAAIRPDRENAVIVGISRASLTTDGFAPMIKATMDDHNLASRRLWLEVDTPASAIACPSAIRALARWDEVGCLVGGEDVFGARAAVGRLAAMGVGVLSLASTLLRGVAGMTAAAVALRSLTRRAQIHGIQVIARGINDPQSATLARTMGVDLLEGTSLSLLRGGTA